MIGFKNKNGQALQRTQYYYPIHPPTTSRAAHNINVDDLPYRTEAQYLVDGAASLENPRSAVDSGVKGISPFVQLATISFPESAPFDVMHLVFLGFVRDLCALLNGSYFKPEQNPLNESDGRMSKGEWV